MLKIYRVLGKKGRITIPYEIRQRIGFRHNDVLSFNGVGKFDIPEIPKSNFSDDTLENLLLIGFDKINTDQSNYERMVHFFLYDYKFENIWKKPDEYVEKLKNTKLFYLLILVCI